MDTLWVAVTLVAAVMAAATWAADVDDPSRLTTYTNANVMKNTHINNWIVS